MTADLVKEFPLEEEYKKKTLISPQDIAKLRLWVETQPHLPAEALTDMDLILTYHCCNRSSEVSKQVLDLHYTLRTLFVTLFKNRLTDENMLAIMHNYLLLPLETRAYDDSKVIYCRLLDYEPKNFILSEAIRSVLMVIDLWQYTEGTWPGFVIIIDLEKVTLSHLARLDLQTVQQFLYYLQEAMLLKLKGLHFLNAPSFMDRLMMILRPFMKKELMDMLTIHQLGSTTIDKFVSAAALPAEAGGHYLTFDAARAEVLAKVRAGSDFYIAENKKRVTESVRPGKPKTITDIFGGIEGSFKKLDID